MMSIRRRVLLGSRKKVIDTSPKIAEYGVSWGRANGVKRTNLYNWCITERYELNPIYGRINVVGYIGADNTNITFQYYGIKDDDSSFEGWYYFNGASSRAIGSTNATLQEITFSIKTDIIDNAYAYIKETGQILFAGKNTPYYGYTNINDMPQ